MLFHVFLEKGMLDSDSSREVFCDEEYGKSISYLRKTFSRRSNVYSDSRKLASLVTILCLVLMACSKMIDTLLFVEKGGAPYRSIRKVSPNEENMSKHTISHLSQTKENDSCQRVCPRRKVNNKIYYVDNAAGLGDRKTMMDELSHLAAFLCADLLLPPPEHLLTPKHNNGVHVSKELEWQDFYNLTYTLGDEPAVKSARDEFGNDFEDWRDIPLFDTRSDGKYKNWKHVVSKYGEWRDDFETIRDYSFLHQDDEHGFIWEIKGALYDSDLYETQLKGPSKDIFKKHFNVTTDQKWRSVFRPKMKPFSGVYCGINGIRSEDCNGCVYTNDEVDTHHLKTMKKSLEKSIRNQVQADSLIGHLHIRRGDAIGECDTRLERIKEYFQCSLQGTENLNRKLTLLFTSDEKDVNYRQQIMSMINDGSKYPHVSILDADKMVKSIMGNALENNTIPETMNNNYFMYDIEYLLQDWSSELMDFHMVRRRSMCNDCLPLMEIMHERIERENQA